MGGRNCMLAHCHVLAVLVHFQSRYGLERLQNGSVKEFFKSLLSVVSLKSPTLAKPANPATGDEISLPLGVCTTF